jgi:hypothetical protein
MQFPPCNVPQRQNVLLMSCLSISSTAPTFHRPRASRPTPPKAEGPPDAVRDVLHQPGINVFTSEAEKSMARVSGREVEAVAARQHSSQRRLLNSS